jgi:hypothetical protein
MHIDWWSKPKHLRLPLSLSTQTKFASLRRLFGKFFPVLRTPVMESRLTYQDLHEADLSLTNVALDSAVSWALAMMKGELVF